MWKATTDPNRNIQNMKWNSLLKPILDWTSLGAVKHYTLGKIVHCDRLLVVSNPCETAAAKAPETPAERLTATGDNGPTSLSYLKNILWSEEKRINRSLMHNCCYILQNSQCDSIVYNKS